MSEPVYYQIQRLDNASAELQLMFALDQCMAIYQIDTNEKARAAQWLADKFPPVRSVE